MFDCKSLGYSCLLLAFLITFLLPQQLISQTTQTTGSHAHEYFVKLPLDLSTLDKWRLLDELNSEELWDIDDVGLALWRVKSFPFTNDDDEEIYDINGIIAGAKRKTRIRSASYNLSYAIVVDSEQVSDADSPCINEFLEHNLIVGDEDVTISILDTGISDISDNSNAQFNFNLTDYSGYDYVDDDDDPEDGHGHGSHIAGLIYSQMFKNGPQPDNIKFDIRRTHNNNGEAYLSDVVLAISDAVDDDASIINMSFSLTDTYVDSLFYPMEYAIKYANMNNVLVVAAAGNAAWDNDNPYITTLPASFNLDNVISVGSISCDKQMSEFSNFGSHSVDIALIGEAVPGPDLSDGITYISGTSQATALFTALAAIEASRNLPTESDDSNSFWGYWNGIWGSWGLFDEDGFWSFLGDDDKDPHFLNVKCALIQSSKHNTDLTDKVISDGYMIFENGFSYEECTDDLCDEEINNLPNLSAETKIYETNKMIESNQLIDNESIVTYDAGMHSTLLPGFEITNGTRFAIITSGCADEVYD